MYTDLDMRSVIKKVLKKNMVYFGKYKKNKFMTVNSSTIACHFVSLLSQNLSFLYFPKYKVFFNRTFLITLILYLSIYVFNVIIFEYMEMWGFKIFKKYISGESTSATKSLLLCSLLRLAMAATLLDCTAWAPGERTTWVMDGDEDSTDGSMHSAAAASLQFMPVLPFPAYLD